MRLRILIALALISAVSSAPLIGAMAQQKETVPSPGIRFIAAQNGKFESTVKKHLIVVFGTHSNVQRAYLVSALYPDRTIHIVLALACSVAPSKTLLQDIQRTFSKLASSSAALDVLFLSNAQEKQVAPLAKPFYVHP